MHCESPFQRRAALWGRLALERAWQQCRDRGTSEGASTAADVGMLRAKRRRRRRCRSRGDAGAARHCISPPTHSPQPHIDAREASSRRSRRTSANRCVCAPAGLGGRQDAGRREADAQRRPASEGAGAAVSGSGGGGDERRRWRCLPLLLCCGAALQCCVTYMQWPSWKLQPVASQTSRGRQLRTPLLPGPTPPPHLSLCVASGRPREWKRRRKRRRLRRRRS